MKFYSLIPLLTLLVYVLPDTPMISSAESLLHPSERKAGGATVVDAGKGKPGGATTVNVDGKGEGVTVHWHKKGNPVPKNFLYLHYSDAPETQLLHDLNLAMLLEKDLKPGHKMKLHFAQASHQASFLPRELANSIPFSLAKLDDILNRFGIKAGSEDAEVMRQTLMDCEEAGIRGEEKHCATSLESMVDFATWKLGEKVEAVSTAEVEAVKERKMQEYTIGDGVEKVGEEKVVGCHRLEYPYAVFYCHKTEKTRAYTVPLEGADGIRMKAVVVCHADTSQWHPKHLAFQVLKVKPGTVPVCHFIPPQDHLIWVPKRLQIL